MRINLRINLDRITVIWVFLFYASTNSFWGYKPFHDSNIFAAAACIIPLILVALNLFFIQKGRIRSGYIEFALSTLLLLVIIESSRFGIKPILFYGMCISLLLLNELADCRNLLKLFYYFAILFAIGSLINLFLPDIYKSVVLPGFTGARTYQRLLKWFKMRNILIIPGFANQTSFNACHFVYGIGYLVSKQIVSKKLSTTEWLSLALFAVCLVLTNKRAHLLFVIMACAICYYCSSKSREKAKRILIIVFGGALLIWLIYLAVQYIDVGVFRKLRIMLRELERDEDITHGRLSRSSIALKYFLKKPLLGIGWEGYRAIPELDYAISTHNIYLELLCETGILGTTVFLLFFLKALLAAIKNLKRCPEGSFGETAFFLLFMQLFFLLYGLTGNPLYDPPYYVPYFMICAYSISLKSNRCSEFCLQNEHN